MLLTTLLYRIIPPLLIAFVQTILVIATCSIIFSGDLAPFFPYGVGASLISSVILGLVLTKLSQIPNVIAQPNTIVLPLLALMAESIAATLFAENASNQIAPTIVAMIASSTMLTGLLFFLLGHFKCGRYFRFIPYPVIGGIIAGIGWLIAIKSLPIMSNVPISWESLKIPDAHMLVQVGSGVTLGLLLVLCARFIHYAAIPILLAISFLLFYALFWIFGLPMTEEWLIGPMPSGRVWPLLQLSDFQLINWSLIAEQIFYFFALLITATLYFQLTTSSLEIMIDKRFDIDEEFKTTGLANILAGSAGGIAGFQTFALIALCYKWGVAKGVGIITMLIALFILFVDGSFLNYFPKPIVGGITLFFGLTLLIDWIYYYRLKVTLPEYLIVLFIVATIGLFGFLFGLVLGLAASCLLFIVNYSRINVIKYALTGQTYQSHVDRSLSELKKLEQKGEEILILKLQGYIFFGTVYKLIESIEKRLKNTALPPLNFLVLDFQLVNGIDSSTAYSCVKLMQTFSTQQVILVFTNVNADIRNQLERGGFNENEQVRFFEDMDFGVEWCENKVLAKHGISTDKQKLPELLSALKPYLEKVTSPAKTYIMRQGDPSQELFLIESGKVSVISELTTGKMVRMRVIGAASIIGEMGFCRNVPRSTSVMTEESTTYYRLSRQLYQKISEQNPKLLLAFNEYLTRVLAERLSNVNTANNLLKR